MLLIGFIILFSAVLTSCATVFVGYLWYQHRLRDQLEARLREIQVEFEQRVRDGVLQAGQELVPELREQVRLGFEDALKRSQAAELVENAAGVVNLGTGLVGGGIGALLGNRRKSRQRDGA